MEDRKAGGGHYRITVAGTLEASWSECLEGMTITCVDGHGQARFALLEGQLVDQAALFGVLSSLHQLRVPILSLELLPDDAGA